MRINSKLGVQHATFDGAGAGEGLAIFLSQNAEATCRYRFMVKAMISEGVFQVGTFYSSPPNATSPNGELSRMIAGAVCPGATSWAVEISAVPIGVGAVLTPETAEVILASSRCCTAPIGVARVSERYQYEANSSPGATQNIIVTPGQTVKSIAAYGLTGGGTVSIGTIGDVAIVPEGVALNLEPPTLIAPNTLIHFSNVDWVFEFLESA